MNIPYWLLRLLPMWEFICPKCRKGVKQSAHHCPHCGEKFPLAIRVPPSFLKDPKKLEAYVHKHVFPRVSEFERNYLTKYFTEIFSDGFEGVYYSPWTGVGTSGFTQAFSAAQYHHGAKSLIQTGYAAGQYAEIYKTIAAAVEYYMRAYIKLGTLGSGNVTTWVGPCVLSSADNNILGAGIRKESDGSRNWCVVNGGMSPHTAYHAADSTINADQWYCLEIYCYVAASPNGIARLYVDGNPTPVVNQTGITTNAHGNIARGAILTWTENGAYHTANCDFFADCVVVADAYIGPEGGATLQTVTDSLSLSDSVLRHKPLLPITQALSLSDSVFRNKTLTIADSVGATDSVKGNKSPLIVSDVLSLADLVNVITGAIIKTVLDTIGLADLALVNKPVAIADTVSVLDAIFRHKPSVTVSDAIGAAEVVLVAKLLAVADSVNLADVARVLKTLNVSDSLTLVDAVSTPSRVLQVTESISLTEVVEVGTGGVKKTRLFLILGDLAVQLAGD
jgi:hypothetical protein